MVPIYFETDTGIDETGRLTSHLWTKDNKTTKRNECAVPWE